MSFTATLGPDGDPCKPVGWPVPWVWWPEVGIYKRKQELHQESDQEKRKFFPFFWVAFLIEFLFSGFLDRFLGRALVFLFSYFLVFFYKFLPQSVEYDGQFAECWRVRPHSCRTFLFRRPVNSTVRKHSTIRPISLMSGTACLLRWEFIKENKNNSTKKVIKKKRFFFLFLGCFLGRVLVFLFSWSLSWSSSCFLAFLIAFLVEFLFSFFYNFPPLSC